jgi:hypothetical protein
LAEKTAELTGMLLGDKKVEKKGMLMVVCLEKPMGES